MRYGKNTGNTTSTTQQGRSVIAMRSRGRQRTVTPAVDKTALSEKGAPTFSLTVIIEDVRLTDHLPISHLIRRYLGEQPKRFTYWQGTHCIFPGQNSPDFRES